MIYTYIIDIPTSLGPLGQHCNLSLPGAESAVDPFAGPHWDPGVVGVLGSQLGSEAD